MDSRQKHFKILMTSLIYMLAAAMVSSCGQSQNQAPQQMSAQQQQHFEKEPQKLKDIEARIEEIVKALDGPSISLKEEKKKEGTASQSSQNTSTQAKTQGGQGQSGQGGQGQSGQQSQSQQWQQGQGQGQQGQQAQQKPQQPQAEDPWKKIDEIIANLHYQWNDYLPDAVKKGANLKITDNFSNALNTLTVTIQSKDKGRTLKAANGLYQYIPDLYSLYRTKMSSEIKRLIYLVRNIVLDSTSDDWTQADTDSSNLDASWSIAKNSLGKEQQADQSKLDFSISELKKVVKAKDKQLTDIKGRVAMTNIESIEKSYEKESGGQGAGSQGSGGQSSGS